MYILCDGRSIHILYTVIYHIILYYIILLCIIIFDIHWQGCGTEDAVASLFHIITKHLDKPNNYVRAPLDFPSAFSTIQTNISVSKMVHRELNPYLIHLYSSFLTDRVQIVKVNKTLSSAITTNVGAPHVCVSSATPSTFFTNDCHTDKPDQYILKSSVDTALISLLSRSGNPGLRQHGVNKVAEWSDNNALEINTKKMEGIVSGSPSDS